LLIGVRILSTCSREKSQSDCRQRITLYRMHLVNKDFLGLRNLSFIAQVDVRAWRISKP